MKFIEIKQGLSVEVKKIIAIEEAVQGANVYTEATVFESIIPYRELINILSMPGEEDKMAESLEALKRNSQFFGG